MPILPVSAADLRPQPSIKAWERVLSIMLSPEDAALAADFAAVELRERIGKFLAGTVPGDTVAVPADDLRIGMSEKSQLGARQQQAGRSIDRGLAAGAVLLGALRAPHVSPHRRKKLTVVKEDVAQIFETSPRDLEKRWDEYRSVAHLYAATLSPLSPRSKFPCDVGQLELFLRCAELLADAGEEHRFHQSAKGPLLRPGQTWRLAPDVL